jgi:hypothetical protein
MLSKRIIKYKFRHFQNFKINLKHIYQDKVNTGFNFSVGPQVWEKVKALKDLLITMVNYFIRIFLIGTSKDNIQIIIILMLFF